jgi:Ca-activated chloride channel homolog
MSAPLWSPSARLRRGIALSAIVLATGGLVLYKSPAGAFPGAPPPCAAVVLADGKNSARFSGPGAHGIVALSHTRVLAGQETRVFAEVRLVADSGGSSLEVVRAPTSLVVVLDTSGSMSGDKMDDAKASVLRLLGEMADDDEIALVSYSDAAELLQPLARVSAVRSQLGARVRRLSAGGGTNIPSGLLSGMRALDEASNGRVRRVVLVSDGLDGTRDEAERLARSSFAYGITVSSLGVGLDFDESYMSSVARTGHGNFGFVNDGASLASFLTRELVETSTTVVENARVRLRLPQGARFVTASGADATVTEDSSIELALGGLFAGDERRVVVEMAVRAQGPEGDRGAPLAVGVTASWRPVGSAAIEIDVDRLTLASSLDLTEVERGLDGSVLASATSVVASERQLEAARAYARGDVIRAAAIASDNERSLSAAASAAPPAEAAALQEQISAYREMKDDFTTISPGSAAGKARAKAAAARDTRNLDRKAF